MTTTTELAAQLAEAIDERDVAATKLHAAQALVDDLSARMTDRAKHAPRPAAKARRGASRRGAAGRSAKPAGDAHQHDGEHLVEHALNGGAHAA